MFKSSAKKRTNKRRVYLTAEERNRPQADEKMLNEYVAKIKGSWQKAVQSILETGNLLIEAKEKLPHGQFGDMVEERLSFGWRKAQMLMRIAEHPVLSNAKWISHLPPSWGTLYDMTQLPDGALEKSLEEGKINFDTHRDDLTSLKKTLQEENTYNWKLLDSNLQSLIRFAKAWPDPERVFRHAIVDFEQLTVLVPWLGKFCELRKALEAQWGEEEQRELADGAADAAEHGKSRKAIEAQWEEEEQRELAEHAAAAAAAAASMALEKPEWEEEEREADDAADAA